MTWRFFNGYGAAIGIAIPLLVMLIDNLSAHGWWPSWIVAIWPTSYMLIATAGTKDLSAYLFIAMSIAINGVLYGAAGALLAAAFRRSVSST